ncbi:hypothetical protein B0T24DRAFT_618179 [Lasiosphaeria ovina]|uniref:Helicase C-terminal domain-containing protein n=1 Tax=Lasiosphaeria ovina TaxID=92902 RepID=A0AAE0KI10_9PEZI|nr:hypothetical protein B0T24DRAFT_618179 [Lasiosphaeria ovina]
MATVSLGMGMDLPDVIRVVQFGLPRTPSLSDIWQRIRRALRNKEKASRQGFSQGTAYIFVPYWAFSQLGSLEKPATKPKAPRRQPRAR